MYRVKRRAVSGDSIPNNRALKMVMRDINSKYIAQIKDTGQQTPFNIPCVQISVPQSAFRRGTTTVTYKDVSVYDATNDNQVWDDWQLTNKQGDLIASAGEPRHSENSAHINWREAGHSTYYLPVRLHVLQLTCDMIRDIYEGAAGMLDGYEEELIEEVVGESSIDRGSLEDELDKARDQASHAFTMSCVRQARTNHLRRLVDLVEEADVPTVERVKEQCAELEDADIPPFDNFEMSGEQIVGHIPPLEWEKAPDGQTTELYIKFDLSRPDIRASIEDAPHDRTEQSYHPYIVDGEVVLVEPQVGIELGLVDKVSEYDIVGVFEALGEILDIEPDEKNQYGMTEYKGE